MIKIPKCMSTQHPDNVNIPFFAENAELTGDDEIKESYYAFSHLGCDEQMWDYEGKEVDNFVVKKLLTKYESYFWKNRLGNDVFITYRVPNPTIEKNEAKILLETLESIPRSFDTAKAFYGDDIPPIFEVILPMTSSSQELNRIYRYYSEIVVGKQNIALGKEDITIAEWIGKFKPEKINVIPLFEDARRMLNLDYIMGEYLRDKDVEYQRVFLARSDPSLNYGLISAVLLNKIALQKLQRFSENTGLKIYPILGLGSSPFRGNLSPQTVDRIAKEYPSVYTFTIQSSFKYDHPFEKVRRAIKKLKKRKINHPDEVDEKICLEIIKKYTQEYTRQIKTLSNIINKVSKYIPSRRKRKLHIGLFGYSRNTNGVELPRAIPFTAAFYSIGLPPEILGINALDDSEIQFVKEIYVNFDSDLKDSFRYLNPDTNFYKKIFGAKNKEFPVDFQIDEEHKIITEHISNLLRKNRTMDLKEHILRASYLRGFLG